MAPFDMFAFINGENKWADLAFVIYGLIVFYPGLRLFIARMHDSGHSGWWALWQTLPLYPAMFIIRVFSNEWQQAEYDINKMSDAAAYGLDAATILSNTALVIGIWTFVLLVLPSSPGINRYNRNGNYKGAKRGFADDQYGLGKFLLDGDKEAKLEGIKWLEKAADQGNADAIYELGRCYELGNGVSENESTAMDLYRRAAECGHKEAQEALDKLQKE
jgi:uncharacterized membrane protein YhaH (DUF805 family)